MNAKPLVVWLVTLFALGSIAMYWVAHPQFLTHLVGSGAYGLTGILLTGGTALLASLPVLALVVLSLMDHPKPNAHR